ncbi:hypothetical protein RI367_004460 [Sorochytrium milnesiophthora]
MRALSTLHPCLAAATLLLLWLSPQASHQQQQQKCNGYVELCRRRYSDVTFAGTHNSYSYDAVNAPPVVSANQESSMTVQLNYGIRFINIDVWRHDESDPTSELTMCHGSCALYNMGPLSNGLAELHDFLAAPGNRGEVVTLAFENEAKASQQELTQALQQAGLAPFVYMQPGPNQTWPTLGDMVQSGQRLVVMSDGSQIGTMGGGGPVPAGGLVMPYFAYVSETPFEIYSEADWTCALDRPKNVHRELVLVNHWIYGRMFGYDVPSLPDAVRVNTRAIMGNHMKKCTAVRQQRVNFVQIDFYESSDVLEVAADLNGLPAISKPHPAVPTPDVMSAPKLGAGGVASSAAAGTPLPSASSSKASSPFSSSAAAAAALYPSALAVLLAAALVLV